MWPCATCRGALIWLSEHKGQSIWWCGACGTVDERGHTGKTVQSTNPPRIVAACRALRERMTNGADACAFDRIVGPLMGGTE